MAIIKFSNNAQTTLQSTITASSTSLAVESGTGSEFPIIVSGSSYFYATLISPNTFDKWEIIKVTARAGDTFTIVRGQQATLAQDWPSGTIVTQYSTAGDLENFIQKPELVEYYIQPPIGSIVPCAGYGLTVPTDYLLCDGQSYLTSQYPYLSELIGNTYGTASAGYFKVPDLRGLFIRGWNMTTSGVDPNRQFASIQGWSMQTHDHTQPQNWYRGNREPHFSDSNIKAGYADTVLQSGYSGGSETRPVNIALKFLIRASY